jgi:hypothetical protein
VTIKNAFFGMLRLVALMRTDVSEERSASIMRVTRIGEQGTTLPATSNRCTLRRFLSPWWWRCYVPPKRQFWLEPYGVTSQKTAFLIHVYLYLTDFSNFCNCVEG